MIATACRGDESANEGEQQQATSRLLCRGAIGEGQIRQRRGLPKGLKVYVEDRVKELTRSQTPGITNGRSMQFLGTH